MPSFGKGGGSRNSHDMRLSGMSGMGLLIYPSLRTYTDSIWIWRGSISKNASMFWVTLAGDFTSYSVWGRPWISWCSYDICRLWLDFLKLWKIMKWTILKVFVKTIKRWNHNQVNTLGHSLSLHFMTSMRVLNFIIGIAGVYFMLQMNEMNNVKYEWMNEADSVFAKEGPRVEIPYVWPSLEMSYATSMIPKSRIY